ncbi:MAG: GNVR domain-containing protein [Acidobacteriaceae bacterium]
MATETHYPKLKESGGLSGSSQPQPPNPEGDEISLLDLLIVLAERKRLILWCTVGFAIVSLIVSLIWPKSYTATAVLLPPRQNSSMGSLLTAELGSLGGMAALAGSSLGIKNPNDMYVGMLKSQTVEDAMVKNFGLMQEYHAHYMSAARKAFESHVTVDGNGKDSLIHISVKDRNPEKAAAMANGYVDAFRRLSEGLAITEASQRRLFFQQQLEQAKNNLANAEEALKKTEQTTGVIQMDSQARALIETAAALRAQITAKEVEMQAMQTYATGENAQMVELQQELDGLRAQLAKLGGSEDNPNSFFPPKGRVPEVGLEYVRKLRDVKYYETIFELLARELEIAKIDEAREGSFVQVVDPAIVPDHKSSPKRALIVIVATFVGFFIGILTALVQAGISRLREDPEASVKLAMLRAALSSRPPPEQ